jgi:hypothetical protein
MVERDEGAMTPSEPDGLLAQGARGVREPRRAEARSPSRARRVRVTLTEREWESLRENATYLNTSVGSLIGWIVTEDIRCEASPPRSPKAGSDARE